MIDKMKKIIVIGCAGGGKSYFSRRLRDVTKLPLYHLDNIYWNEDGTTIEKPIFYRRLQDILKLDEWIIDGNYKSTMDIRMQECDTVFFLDLPADVCLAGIHERRGKPRSDIAWKNTLENDDEEFVNFIKNYNTEHRPHVIDLIKKHSDKNIIIFNSRNEADEYILNFNK